MTLVSVNCVVKNREDFIARAIESVLSQSFVDWELVVIDNESEDNTAAIIKDYAIKDKRIKYFYSSLKNIGANRNLALNKSIGRYIAVIDSDDFWIDNNKLKKQLDYLENHKKCVLLGTNVINVDVNGQELAKQSLLLSDGQIRNSMTSKNSFIHSSVIYDKAAALSVEAYLESSMGEDYELWLKLGLLGEMANLPNFSTAYRIHQGNEGYHKEYFVVRQAFRIVRKFFEKYPKGFKSRLIYWLRIIKIWFKYSLKCS